MLHLLSSINFAPGIHLKEQRLCFVSLQLRLDFLNFQITGPSTSSVSAVKLNNGGVVSAAGTLSGKRKSANVAWQRMQNVVVANVLQFASG